MTRSEFLACLDCRVPIPRRMSGAGAQLLRCDTCWGEARKRSYSGPDVARPCPDCGEPAALNRTYCADHLVRPRRPYESTWDRICPCGEPAAQPSYFCSEGCRREARRASSRRSYASRTPEAKKRHNALKAAAGRPYKDPRWRRVRLEVLARGGPCGICGEPIDYELKFPDPMSPCVDHIVAWRDGGAWFDPANLRPAHFRCNNARRGSSRDEVAS